MQHAYGSAPPGAPQFGGTRPVAAAGYGPIPTPQPPQSLPTTSASGYPQQPPPGTTPQPGYSSGYGAPAAPGYGPAPPGGQPGTNGYDAAPPGYGAPPTPTGYGAPSPYGSAAPPPSSGYGTPQPPQGYGALSPAPYGGPSAAPPPPGGSGLGSPVPPPQTTGSPANASQPLGGAGGRRRMYPEAMAHAYTQPLAAPHDAPGSSGGPFPSAGYGAAPQPSSAPYGSAPSGAPGPPGPGLTPGPHHPTPAFGTASQDPSQTSMASFDATMPQPNVPMPLYPKATYGSTMSMGGSVDAMANSFSHLGMNQPIMQPASTQAIALIGAPPAPHEVHAPPPAIRLSPQAACTLSPNSNCSPTFKRCTVNVFPQTSALQAKSKIPLALYIAPYRDPEPGEPEIPIINTNTIVRCRRCRTYINPYVQFLDRGQRWKCNMCYYPNDVPEAFDFDVTSQSYIDRWQRPELNHAVVEFIAPSEYMLRPPQPAVYLFVIDVSYVAVQSGMVHMAAQIIKDALEALPNSDNRAMVGFLTVDSALHFYNLSAQQAEPQMLVVGDLEDVFLPLPTDLLANLTDCKDQIMALLDRLPGLHAGTTNSRNALGPALLAADKLVAAYGGKIVVLQSQLPNEREGALKPREEKPGKLDPAAFKASDPFYKQFAVDCSRSQVSVDLFLFPQNNGGPIDVATLAAAPQYTGGNVYMYPAFHASRKCDVDKFAAELTHVLTRPLGLEAVLRVRASRGIRMAAYHGNFFVRSTDLLSLPNVNPSNTYAVELAIDETIQGSVVCFQTALLHTTAYGERRIRVVTLALPVTTSLTDMMHAADPGAIINILARKAQERVLESKFEDARDAIINKVVDILGTYKSGVSGNSSHSAAQLTAPENLKLLPVLALGLSKHPALRVHPAVPTDVRAYYMNVLRVASVEGTLMGAHPTFYPIHRILVDTADLGTIVDGTVRMPPYPLPVSSERLERNGVFLLTDGIAIYLWVSRAADPSLLQALFSVSSYDSLASGATCLPVTGHPYSERLANIIGKLRQRATQIASVYPTVFVVKEDGDPALRMWALGMLVEDRHEYGPSYPQFLTTLREKVASYSG